MYMPQRGKIIIYAMSIAALFGWLSPITCTASGFYVIPVVKEVCTGTPVGAKAFELSIESSMAYLWTGKIYATTTGRLVEITGIVGNSYDVHYYPGSSFLVAPDVLPVPDYGVKGPFYHLIYGQIAFAKYL